MYNARWNRKPPLGTPINPEHPWAPYIDTCIPMLSGQGPTPLDHAREAPLSLSGTAPTWAPGPIGGLAPSLPGGSYWTLPAAANLGTRGPGWAVSYWFNQLSSFGTSNPHHFDNHNNSGWYIQVNNLSAMQMGVYYNNVGGWTRFTATVPTMSLGRWYHAVWTLLNGRVYLYLNGVQVANQGGGTSVLIPYPTATPTLINEALAGGSTSFNTAYDNILILDGIGLNASQVADLYGRPWQIFGRRPSLAGATSIVPTLSTSSTLYANGSTQSISLVGYDTAWTGGTTFSVSGISGYSKASQSVADATHATVGVAAGTTSGTLTVSDGTLSATVPSLTPTLSASPATIPSGHSGNVAIALTGVGTAWGGGTTFTVSGVTGASKASQSVASATSATLDVTTGSGAGTLTISDGSHTTTVSVAAPSLAASTTTTPVVATGGPYTLNLAGTNTLWASETPSTLFTISGVSGASISSIAVQSDTAATATLTVGTSGGIATIADASTGATTTLSVAATPSGSLHVEGQCILQHSAGTFGLFGGKTAAGLAFRFKALSAAGAAAYSGTKVIGFATTSGSLPTVAYQPATGLMIFNVYAASLGGTTYILNASVPVQAGVGYHFLVSWGSRPQLYVDGVLYASATFTNAATYAYSKIQVGGDAGAGVALDHQVSDLMVWGSYAPTASDALALATGSTAPLALGTPPSAWWPLGGGPSGSNPAASGNPDIYVQDWTGNGNTLAVAAGSELNAVYTGAIGLGSPATIAPFVPRSGKLAMFGATSAAQVAGAGYPVLPITAVPGTPTVYRNGTAVQLGPPVWCSSGYDTPYVAYLLQCGGVQQVAIADGGSGYTTPTATVDNTGTGGSGLTLGTPALATGVTGYTITNRGSGYAQPPALNFSDVPGSGAIATAVHSGGSTVTVTVVDGGSGYYNPTVTLTGGGGTYAAATPTVVGGVITAITVTGASGYTGNPKVAIGDTGPGTGAAGYVVVVGGTIGSVVVTAGGSGYLNPVATLSGSGSGGVLSPVLSGGAVVAVNVPNPGSGYANGPTITVADPPSTAGPTGGVTANAMAIVYDSNAGALAGQIRSIIPLAGGNPGCGSGYSSGSPPAVTIAGSGGAAATAVVAAYVAYIPVTSPGSGYNKPPAITIGDTGGTPSRVASVAPIMSGVSAGDTMTYDGPAGWLTASQTISAAYYPLGGLRAVSAAPMDNWTGRREGATGGFTALTSTPSIPVGANVEEQAIAVGAVGCPLKNRYKQGNPWTNHSGTTVAVAADGTPISWTNPASSNPYRKIVTGYTNEIDSDFSVSRFGRWTFVYDEPNVNTANNSVVVPSVNGTCTPVNLSGPNVGTTTPVTVNPADVHFTNNGPLTSITLNSTTVGTGWQAAVVVIAGGGNPSKLACANATVSGGTITAINLVQPGAGYTSAPTVTLYGTALSGTTITAVYEAALPASPTSYALDLTVDLFAPPNNTGGSDGLAYYNLGDLWIVAPDPVTGAAAASVDRTKPLAPDDGVIAQLTVGGKVPGSLRFMDLTQNYGGYNNAVFPNDLIDPTWTDWGTNTTYIAPARYVRYYNTDPASAKYAWSSTKVYGPTAAFTEFDPPYTATGTLASGSKAITGIPSDTPLMTASTIAGAGIPSGTLIAAITVAGDGTLVATITQAATASGPQTLTITNPPYLPVAPGDDGAWIDSSFNAQSETIFEVRFERPHGVTSTNTVLLQGKPAVQIPITNTAPWGKKTTNAAFVTGPYTIVFTAYTGGSTYPGTPAGYVASRVNSTTEIDTAAGGPISFSANSTAGSATINNIASTAGMAVGDTITGPGVPAGTTIVSVASGTSLTLSNPVATTSTGATFTDATPSWILTMTVPMASSSAPYDFAAAMVAALPGCGYWLNIPWGATDALIREIAARTIANIGPTNPVYIEYSNEMWNGNFPPCNWFGALGNLHANLAPGTTVAGYLTANGLPAPFSQAALGAVLTAHAQDVFTAAWTAAGNDASRIRRVQGSWWAGAGTTQQILEIAQACGFGVDYVAVAPYYHCPGDQPVMSAFAQAGSPYGQSGSWPVEAINDFYRLWQIYSPYNQNAWGTHAQACQSLGQPTRALKFNDFNATATAALTPTTIASIAVTAGGSGYSSSPNLALYGGGGTYTSISATVVGGAITAINVVGSAGFTSVPAVQIWDSTGSGAAATASLTPTSLGAISLTNAGSEYVSAPSVSLSGGGGSGAAATTTLAGDGSGSIASVNVATGGSGYTSPPSVAFNGGGSLATGPISATYTFTDSGGRETTIGVGGNSRSASRVASPAGVMTLEMPNWPTWASAFNIYLSQPSGAPGSETLYRTIPRSQYNTKYPAGAQVPLAQPIPAGGRTPPTTNAAAANLPAVLPKTVTYEGAVEIQVPKAMIAPLQTLLLHDTFAHPSAREVYYDWHMGCQWGSQAVPGSGAVLTNYYQLYNQASYAFRWALAYGNAMIAGDGSTNRFASIQGGYPADGHDHNGGCNAGWSSAVANGNTVANTSAGLLGFQDFIGAAAAITPTILSTTPASSASAVAIDAPITIAYSTDMNPATLSLTLQASAFSTVHCNLTSYDPAAFTAVFAPQVALGNDTNYTATANGFSAAGVPLAAAVQWSFTTAYLAPSVTSVSPANNAIGIAIGTTITANLSGTVDPGSVTFSVVRRGFSAISGTTTFSGGVATFTPSANLNRYEFYDVTLDARAPDGTAMPTYSWSFRAQASPPTVVDTTPAASAILVDPAAAIVATFSESIVPATLSLTLSPSAQVGPPSYDPGTFTATWTPTDGGLATATSYTATVSATQDDGTTMTAPYSFGFDTRDDPPVGTGVILEVGYAFSGPIDHSGLRIDVSVAATGTTVPGSLSYDATSNLATFLADAALSQVKYTVRVSGAKAPDGTPMAPVVFPITPGPQRTTGWNAGMGRQSQGS